MVYAVPAGKKIPFAGCPNEFRTIGFVFATVPAAVV